MNILWNEQESYFQAEIMPDNLKDEVSFLKKAGFKTFGPPSWVWYTSKASVLNKLRKTPPKSGLTITELALSKYQFLNQQEQSKLEVKKQFKKAQEAANEFRFEEYLDQDYQFVCFVVKPADTAFVWDYRPPAPPTARCLGCDDPLYFPFNDRAFCIWCEIVENSA